MRSFSIRLLILTSLAAGHLSLDAPMAAEDTEVDVTATRLSGVTLGPHAVGFDARAGLDPTRHINASDAGTRIGLAIWYPAVRAGRTPALSGLDYRLLGFHRPLSDAEKRRFAEDEAYAAMGWGHIGIVPMDRTQALATLSAPGIAVRGLPRSPGRFPVIIVLGGQHYLSSTAETLASHGFVVAAPIRPGDVPNEVGTASFTWYIENSVRDAEWALNELRTFENADRSRVGAIGHGGGGIQALLFAMRNTSVGMLVNIDAGNFSSRSQAQAIPFYSPRLLRIPYLYVATAETRKIQDKFDDFLAMRFSDRIEVTLQDPAVRHHDLSDFGRPVTAPLGIRGESMPQVQQAYADVQDMTVRFFRAHSGVGAREDVAGYLRTRAPARSFTVATYPGGPAAPTVEALLAALSEQTAATLADARGRDPDAPVFRADNLSRIVARALALKRFALAESVAGFALGVYPGSPPFLDYRSEALEGRGDVMGATGLAATCAASPANNDWRASAAIARCRDRLDRLNPSTGTPR
jgi:dienelactone hydrolase